MRYKQVKNLKTVADFRAHLETLEIELPVVDEVTAEGPMTEAVSFVDGSAGEQRSPNRFAILPMEGWDATTDGRPTDLVRRRWGRFGASGAGLVWGEATAVRLDGRANPNQLVLDEAGVEGLSELRRLLDPSQLSGLQLTHSGRYARPIDAPRPRTAYEHPVLDGRVGVDGSVVFSDDELDELVEAYIAAAVRARDAGFDFVDVKHCHGYLLHELLSAYDRPGRFGGDLAGRTNFLRLVVAGIRDRAPNLAIAVRLSIFDLVPFKPGADGVGVPDADDDYRFAFGGSQKSGRDVDLAEPVELLDILNDLGVGLVCATAGSPYYNPHIQRPAFFPPSDGYRPPEDPLIGVARLIRATADLKARHPEMTIIGAGYSYLQEWLAHVGQAVVATGGADMIGLGRMALSYPNMPNDVLRGQPFERSLLCRTFSDCTTAPRSGLISGCFPIDPLYKDHPQRVELTKIKRDRASSDRINQV